MRIHAINLDNTDSVDKAVEFAGLVPGIWYSIVADPGIPAVDFRAPLAQLKTAGAKIMLSPFDSTAEPTWGMAERKHRIREFFPVLRGVVDMWEAGNEWNLPALQKLNMSERMSDCIRYLRVNGAKTCLTTYLECDNLNAMWNLISQYAGRHPDASPHFAAWSYYPNWNGEPKSWDVLYDKLGGIFHGAEWLGVREYGIEPFGTPNDKDSNEVTISRTPEEILTEKQNLIASVEGAEVKHPKYCGFGGYWDGNQDLLNGPLLVDRTFQTAWKIGDTRAT